MIEELRCGFCAKAQHSVRKLIAGPLVFICDECVAVCVEIIKDDERIEARNRTTTVAEPAESVPSSVPALIDRVAELSADDQWLLVMHLVARLCDRRTGEARNGG